MFIVSNIFLIINKKLNRFSLLVDCFYRMSKDLNLSLKIKEKKFFYNFNLIKSKYIVSKFKICIIF